MIINCIDIMDGQAVQLVGGKETVLEAGSPVDWARRFGPMGEIAVVDLDAALGQGENREQIEALCSQARCRVGGGIRSVAAAKHWLDLGATRVVLGTAAKPEVLSQLPRQRVIAALDAIDGEVVIDGWRTKTGQRIEDLMTELRPYVGGFLVTFVEREGRMGGIDLERVGELVAAADGAQLTVAGGITSAEQIAALDRMGVDAQVGMAIYTGALDWLDAFAAPMKSDRRDGLWATVVCDPYERALGLCWSDRDSLRQAIESRRGVYRSRSRGQWVKGETSGATQRLLRVDVDCDRDALRFVVEQEAPGFCHEQTESCWGPLSGLPSLADRLRSRAMAAPEGSYTKKLLDDPALLRDKLLEEAAELAEARSPADVAWEAADVIYFAWVALARAGVPLDAVNRELDRRMRLTTRRSQDPEENVA